MRGTTSEHLDALAGVPGTLAARLAIVRRGRLTEARIDTWRSYHLESPDVTRKHGVEGCRRYAMEAPE